MSMSLVRILERMLPVGERRPKDGDIFEFDCAPKYFDQCRVRFVQLQVLTPSFCIAKAYALWPDNLDVELRWEADWRNEARRTVKPYMPLTICKLETFWADSQAWEYSGIIYRFDPALSWGATLEHVPSTPLDLKAANESPGRTGCAACGAKLQAWSSGWSVGKYCPYCEK